jgi:group I intron endonuclease
MIGVYKIESKINPQRVYIGSSKDITHRWKEHIKRLKNHTHNNRKLVRHFDKYGVEDFQFSILLCCDIEELLSVEQYFIDIYNPYFNISKIAGSCLGCKHTEESKKQRSISHIGLNTWKKGSKNSDETRKLMSIAHLGKKPNLGRKFSEETKKKMSIKKIGNTNGFKKGHKIRSKLKIA